MKNSIHIWRHIQTKQTKSATVITSIAGLGLSEVSEETKRQLHFVTAEHPDELYFKKLAQLVHKH